MADSQSSHRQRAALLRPVPYEITTPVEAPAESIRSGKVLSLNISSGGILVLMDQSPEIGQVLKVYVPTPILQTETPTLVEVRWTRKLPFEQPHDNEAYFNGLTHQADPPTILGCSPLNLARDPASDDSMLEARGRGRSDSRSIPLKRYTPLKLNLHNIHMSSIVYPTIMKRVGFVSARSLASRTCTIKSSCQFQVVRFFRASFTFPFALRRKKQTGHRGGRETAE